MNTMIRDLRDMTDSREMLEAKTSPFIAIFIYFILSAILIALIWSYFGEIDEVVKATGVVRPNEQVSSIKTKVTGKTLEVNYLQGQRVKRGDILFTLEREELELQKNALNDELAKLDIELALLARYKQSVIDNINYFSLEDDYYYNLFLQYQIDYQRLAVELELRLTELDKSTTELARAEQDNELNSQLYNSRLAEAKQELANMELLEKSIIEQNNYFLENEKDYYNRYRDYELQLERLQVIVERSYQKMLVSVEIGEEYIPRMQIEEDTQQYKSAKLDLDSYTNNYLMNTRIAIGEQEKLIKELELNIERTELNITADSTGQSYFAKQGQLSQKELTENEQYKNILLEKYQIDKLVAINEQIKLYEDKRKNIIEQLKNVAISIQNHIITSPIDGIVNVVTEINKGDLTTSGIEILKIIPESDSEYKVMLTVLNKNISEIKVGDDIKYHFLALPFKEYGEIKGKINKISIDSTMNPQDGNSFYIVEASIDNQALYSYKGQEANIKVGMLSEAYVITDSKKILYYLLEKIDLRN